MKLNVSVKANDGRHVRVTAEQAQAIEAMTNTRKGGCASVVGYKPSSNYKKSPTQDIQLISHFSVRNLYKRRLQALKGIRFEDLPMDKIMEDEKLSELDIRSLVKLFNERKGQMIHSLEKSLDGDRDDAHRQAHDRCYAHIGDVKVHLKTEKDSNGVKQPVTDEDGYVYCDSIMVPYLELNVKEREAGERKVVNSGAPVRMSNMIESCLNKRSVRFKTLSLKEDNFEAFHIDHQEFLPEHVANFGEDILNISG